MNKSQISKITAALERFQNWLDRYGETSYDFQTFFAGEFGRSAKARYYRKPLLGTLAVAPLIFGEAFIPSTRRFFWKKQRFPIADAHFAMGFAFLSQVLDDERYYKRAVHFLEILKETRCPGFEEYCWGYPFDWVTRNGTIKAGTPLITTVPYVYEAFRQVHEIDGESQWREIMHSIARHAARDYHDIEISPTASTCSYMPDPNDVGRVVNASAYRAFLLMRAEEDFSEESYRRVAERNLNFVLESQNADGSWYYAKDGVRDFVDHFHTCFVLKALTKIEQLTGCRRTYEAIERGVGYYVKNLFDSDGLPRPFAKAPRLTVYRRELYDYAECINLSVLLQGRFSELDRILPGVLSDVLERWQTSEGAFRSRQLMLGWDNVPMHRWAQAQLFRSLSYFVSQNLSNGHNGRTTEAVASIESRVAN